MRPTDLPMLFKELRMLCAIFRRDFDDQLGMAYAETLAAVPIEVIVANAKAAAAGDRFPLPKDLMATPEAESPEVAATRAWELTRPHFTRRTEPTDPIAREVVHLLGGSAQIAGRDSDEVGTWVRKEFIKLYIERAKDNKRQGTVRRSLVQSEVRGIGHGEPAKLDAGDFRAALIESQFQGAAAATCRAVPPRARWLEPSHQVKDRVGVVVSTVGEYGGYVHCVAESVIFVEFTKPDGDAVRQIFAVPNNAKGTAS